MAMTEVLLAAATDAALGVWLGAMLFFSFVGAPRIFRTLGREEAGRVVNAIFPRYYEIGVALGAVTVLAGLARWALGTAAAVAAALVVTTAVGIAAHAYARWVLVPRIVAAEGDAFERYHRRSVILNGVAMLAVAAALLASHLPAA